jgi:hypothetical protein
LCRQGFVTDGNFFIVSGRRPGTSHVYVGWLAPARHVRDCGGRTVSRAKSKNWEEIMSHIYISLKRRIHSQLN